jgi:signal peptidase II
VQERRVAPALSVRTLFRHEGLRRLLVAGAVAAAVVAADQVSKSWAVDRLSRGPIHVVWKLDLQLTFNSGSAFSLAQGWGPVIGGLAAVAVIVLLAVVRKARSAFLPVALGLVVGGAVGNLSDRIFRSHHGSVVDFIALHFWPTFNVADSAVVIGSIWAALLLWGSDSRPTARPTDTTARPVG